MKLIKEIKLFYQDGKSDKVYEVDLCETEPDLYVVNFRYGKRGSTLKEGTKTVFPVAFDEASKTFDKLVTQKTKKGYQEKNDNNISASKDTHEDVNIARDEAVVKLLKEVQSGHPPYHWPLSRIIWRAGVLGLTEAIPYIKSFMNNKDDMEQYATLRTLIVLECDSEKQAALDLFTNKGITDKVGRIALTYLLKYNAVPQSIFDNLIEVLPEDYKAFLKEGDEKSIELTLKYTIADEQKKHDKALLFYLYILSNAYPILRKPILNVLDDVPTKLYTFNSLRYIYRASELLGDFDFYGKIAKAIGTNYPSYTYYGYNAPNYGRAFGKKTKNHLNNNSYKTVYYLSKKHPDQYIQVAKAILCALNEEKDRPRESSTYDYEYNDKTGSYDYIRKRLPRYHQFKALMYIIYGNSKRILADKDYWYYLGEPVNVLEIPREEALPELWNERPHDVLEILAKSKSDEGIFFALKILKDQPEMIALFTPEILENLVINKNELVQTIAYDCLQSQYSNSAPDTLLLLAILQSPNEKIFNFGLKWLEHDIDTYFSDFEFLFDYLKIGNIELLEKLFNYYSATKPDTDKKINSTQLQQLVRLFDDCEFAYEHKLLSLIETTHFQHYFDSLSGDDINKLLELNTTIGFELATVMFKINKQSSFELAKDHINTYLSSRNHKIKSTGFDLLSTFPISYLLAIKDDIYKLCFSDEKEVRNAIKPVVVKLFENDRGFKQFMLSQLIRTISEEELHEGIHQNNYDILVDYFKEEINQLDKPSIIMLISSKYEMAQKLGTPLFLKHIALSSLTIEELVSLTKSDVKEIRDSIRSYFFNNVARIQYESETALKIVNSQWNDVHDWAFDFFDKNFNDHHWSLAHVLYLCDHTNPEVQSFGKHIVKKTFKEENGLELLLKLQEHPTKSMQFFATNYLQSYAANNPEVIFKLKDFFKTILFSINENSVAKQRIYKFLKQESLKNKDVAEMTITLMNALLATHAIQDKSTCIDILLTINEHDDSLEIPITIKSVTHAI